MAHVPSGEKMRAPSGAQAIQLGSSGISHSAIQSLEIPSAQRTGAPIWLHKSDLWLWDSLEMQCRMWGIPYSPVPGPDHWIEDEQDLQCGGSCIHTPGHTPGSASFYFEGSSLLIAGDTLFLGSVGRTDLPGGSSASLQASIRDRLYVLDEDTVVITGHGPETTITHEKRHNAFVRAG